MAARVAWLRRNNLFPRLQPSTGAVRSRMPNPVGSAGSPQEWQWSRAGLWRPQPARWSPRDGSAAHGGPDWRPPHLCGRVVASWEVLLAGLCRRCRLAGGDGRCRKPSNNGRLQPRAGGTPTETSPERFGTLSVADLGTDL